MALINLTGFETGAADECTLSGTASIQSSTIITGDYSLRTNPTTTATGYAEIKALAADGTATDANVATSYIRFKFRYATKPATDAEPLFAIYDSGSSQKCSVRLVDTGVLRFTPASGSSTAGATVLAANTTYRVEIKVSTGASSAFEVKLDGTSELSGTGDLGTNNAAFVRLGKSVSLADKSVDFFFDDFVWKDDAYPGAGTIQRMAPNAQGFYSDFSPNTGTETECVDDNPHDGDTTYISDSFSFVDLSSTFELESASSAGISGTINGVKPYIIAHGGGSSTHGVRMHIDISDYDSGQSTASDYRLVAKVHSTNPDTTVAWTTGDLDALQVGIAVTSAAGGLNRCTAVGAMVDFTEAAPSWDASMMPMAFGNFHPVRKTPTIRAF